MPTASELKSIGRNDLHCKISKTRKYSGWANQLGISLTSCNTRKGQRYEDEISVKLNSLGFKVERMSTKYAYDLLVNGLVKIDVKAGGVWLQNGKYPIHSFGINKKKQTCDIYVLASLGEGSDIEKIFVVPSHLAKVGTISMGAETRYAKFLDRFDYISKYDEFLRSIN